MPRQAYSLDVLEAEIDAKAPHRSTISDGGLASPAHSKANPDSDHEPNEYGVWTARDITDDPTGAMDGSDLFHRLKAKFGKHPAMGPGSYLIHNSLIVSYNRLAEGLRPYAGYNAHEKHLHISVSDARTGYDSRLPWNLWAANPTRPVAVSQPSMLDLTLAVKRFAEHTQNDEARELYTFAIPMLGSLVADNRRVRVPTTISGIVAVLTAKRELVQAEATKAKIDAVVELLHPLIQKSK